MCNRDTCSFLQVARVLHCSRVDKDIEIVMGTIMIVTKVIIKIMDL